MAFNFGSLFTAIGRALPGYIEGRQKAVEDNWNDLNQYNKVQAGQLQNAWTEATWDPALTNVWLQMVNNTMATANSGMSTAERVAQHPGRMTGAYLYSDWAGPLYARMYEGMMRNPNAAAAMGVGGMYPGYQDPYEEQRRQQQQAAAQGAQTSPSGLR